MGKQKTDRGNETGKHKYNDQPKTPNMMSIPGNQAPPGEHREVCRTSRESIVTKHINKKESAAEKYKRQRRTRPAF